MLGTPKPLEGLQGLLSLPQGALNAWDIHFKPPLYGSLVRSAPYLPAPFLLHLAD